MRIEFLKSDNKPGNYLSHIIEDVLGRKSPTEILVEERHLALLDAVESKERFEYHPVDDSISLNGRHFTKNIQAKIFRKLLSGYFQEGKRVFEFRDFKRDAEISLNSKNSHFEVRLARLKAILESKSEKIRITSDGPGTLSLTVKEGVEFIDS